MAKACKILESDSKDDKEEGADRSPSRESNPEATTRNMNIEKRERVYQGIINYV